MCAACSVYFLTSLSPSPPQGTMLNFLCQSRGAPHPFLTCPYNMRMLRAKLIGSAVFLFVFRVVTFSADFQSDLLIWFDKPATQFTQSLPLGNGRLGAMIFGGVGEEKIVLNENSL